MSLVLGAITPHPPLAIPAIGRENLKQIKKTKDAFRQLEGDLYAAKPDSILVISPHGPIAADSFLINVATDFQSNLEEFGDHGTKLQFKGDLELASKIQEAVEDDNIPISMVNQPSLDHGVTVPLFYLTAHLPEFKVVPLSFSLLDIQSHFRFGQIIGHEIIKSNKRIAVVASGDLSHRLNEGAPAGYSPAGKKFDQMLAKLLEKHDVKGILNIDPALAEEAGECGLRSIIVLLGVFSQTDYVSRVLSYEGPFGVGYLVASFNIK
jgi:aromatic ring-opening dioxygenase LigB subunit